MNTVTATKKSSIKMKATSQSLLHFLIKTDPDILSK